MSGLRFATLGAALLLGLAGCGALDPAATSESAARRDFLPAEQGAPAPSRDPETALDSVTLLDGALAVAGPEGYCVDPASVRDTPREGFAVIASCHVLSGGRKGADVIPAVVAIAVGPRGGTRALPEAETIAAHAETQLLRQVTTDDLVLANLSTGGDAVVPDADARFWRGAFSLDRRLVGLSLYVPKGSALAAEAGGAFLTTVQHRIVEESARSSDAVAGRGGARPFEGMVQQLLGR